MTCFGTHTFSIRLILTTTFLYRERRRRICLIKSFYMHETHTAVPHCLAANYDVPVSLYTQLKSRLILLADR